MYRQRARTYKHQGDKASDMTEKARAYTIAMELFILCCHTQETSPKYGIASKVYVQTIDFIR